MNHHIRSFLKEKLIFNVPVSVLPGDNVSELKYVKEFDESILKIIQDPSDAVLFGNKNSCRHLNKRQAPYIYSDC